MSEDEMRDILNLLIPLGPDETLTLGIALLGGSVCQTTPPDERKERFDELVEHMLVCGAMTDATMASQGFPMPWAKPEQQAKPN